MSRIGKQPVSIPEGVKVNIRADKIDFEGSKGKLTSPLLPGIKAKIEDNHIVMERTEETPKVRAFHGLIRTLAHNCCVGVSKGFERKLEIVGVGYRAKLGKGQVEWIARIRPYAIIAYAGAIEIVVAKPTLITIKGIDKQRVGQEAHIIRSFRPPEPYKLKGIRYEGEKLIKKERKAGVVGV